MWIRSAYWTGTPKAGQEQKFRDAIDGNLLAGLKALPAVRDVKILWPKRLEDSPPDIHCQILVYFDDVAGIDQMLASGERAELRKSVVAVAGLFDGQISHIDFEVVENAKAD